MSFSSDIKEKISVLENDCPYCRRAQLLAMIRYTGRIKENTIILVTENESVARCLIRLISETYEYKTAFEYKEKSRLYEIVIDDEAVIEAITGLLILTKDDYTEITPKICCRDSYVKGAFLGGGSISDPHKSYHMEFDARYEPEADRLCSLLNSVGIGAKITCRKGHFIVYIKEYEAIADVLGMIGDTNAALDVYNISVEKDVRNNINRQMNCENANMDKVADAYMKHLAAIEKIKRTIGLDKLPDTLQEIAQVRIMYPEDSLKQLGERLDNPIGKSGVNHRLNRIVDIAENISEHRKN